MTSLRLPRGWSVAICQPEAPNAAGCQPTVLSRSLYQVAGDLSTYHGSRYRGSCFGCRWQGPERGDENLPRTLLGEPPPAGLVGCVVRHVVNLVIDD